MISTWKTAGGAESRPDTRTTCTSRVTRTATRSSSSPPGRPPAPQVHHPAVSHQDHHEVVVHAATGATTTRSSSSAWDTCPTRGTSPPGAAPPRDQSRRPPAPRGPRPRHQVSQSTEAASQSTTPPAGHRTSEGIASGHDAPQGRLEALRGSGRQQVHRRQSSHEDEGRHQDHHLHVQSQDHHQAVRTPPGPRHGWRSGIGATTGHRRATGPPIEAEATTRPATRHEVHEVSHPDQGGHPPATRPSRRRRSPGPP